MPEQHPLSRVFLDSGGGLRASWRLLLVVSLYLFFLFAWNWSLYSLSIALAARLPLFHSELLVLSVLNGTLSVLLATILMLAAVERRGLGFVGFGLAPGWSRHLAVGFAGGVAMMILIVALEAFTGHLRLSISAAGPRDLVPLLFAFVLFALGALHEELLFRGYAFQRMMDILGPLAATLLVAAAFGAVHLGNPHVSRLAAGNTALVGILFALLYLRSRRLWLPIGLHWGWNFAEAGFGLPVSGITIEGMPLRAEWRGAILYHGGSYGPEGSVLATAVIALATLLIVCWKPALRPDGSKEVT